MKICRVFANFQTDLNYAEHYIAKELSRLDHSTTFITSARYLNFWKPYLRTKDGIGYKKFDGFDVYRIKSVSLLEKTIFTNWVKLYRLLFVKNKFDVLHLSGVGTFCTLIVLLLDKFNKRQRPRIVISDHTHARSHKRSGFFAQLNYTFFKLLFTLLGGRVAAIVSFDKVGVDVLSKRYHIPLSKFVIIPLGYDSRQFYYHAEEKNVSHKMLIGYAGKIGPKKKLDTLIHALSKAACRQFVTLIAIGVKEGDPYASWIRSLAASKKLDADFRPFASTEELAKFYRHINLAVFPGEISITTIEANGCGTPVIIHRSIDGLDVRVDNGRGLLFSEEVELTAAIEKYYLQFSRNEIDYKRIAETTATGASWVDLAKKYLTIYTDAYSGSLN